MYAPAPPPPPPPPIGNCCNADPVTLTINLPWCFEESRNLIARSTMQAEVMLARPQAGVLAALSAALAGVAPEQSPEQVAQGANSRSAARNQLPPILFKHLSGVR